MFIYILLSYPIYAIDVEEIVVIPKVVVDSTGFSGDLAVDPTDGTLHCIWSSSSFELKHISRRLDGVWSDTEIIPTLGMSVYADEGEGGSIPWTRNCCGITIDEQGVVHIAYGVKDGDLYYVFGKTNQWSDPYRVASPNQWSDPYRMDTDTLHACHPEIEVMDDNIYIIWENAEESLQKEVYQASRIHGEWTEPRFVMFADNPDLYMSDYGILYLIGRLHNYELDNGLDHHVMFGYSVPGFTDWQIKQLTDSEPYRIGKAPRLAIHQGKIYMAWSISKTVLNEPDKKGRLYCAFSYEPGTFWDVTYSPDNDPLYTVATGDPYGCVAVYSNGTIFYANGKAGNMAVHSDQSFKIWLGNRWSGLRPAEWEDGIAHLVSDGQTIWAIGSSSGYSDREVSVSGYTNPSAEHFDFANHAPQIVAYPDTFALVNSLWQTSCQAVDPDGDPIRYNLRFPVSGSTIDTVSGIIQWQTSEIGTHMMGVRVTDNRGKSDVHHFRLHVVDQFYQVDFSANPAEGIVPVTTQFANLSQGPINQYEWDFGDGTTSSLENPAHTYTEPGSYSVILKVTGEVGSDSLIQSNLITVNPVPVVAKFGASPVTGIAPLAVQFTDSSTGDINTWLWSFGDGLTSAEQHPSHIYQESDTYSVTLNVSGPYGENSQIQSEYIHVSDAPPVAHFSAEPRSGLENLVTQFTDSSSGTIHAWQWDFGDGKTSQEQHPMHAYSAIGDYTVQLTVTGPGGSDVKNVEKYIHVGEIIPPGAVFIADPVTGYAPLTVQFNNESSGSSLDFMWYFGDFSVEDGGTSEEANPSYTYQQPGNYSVLLTVIGPDSSDAELKHNLIQVLEPTHVKDELIVPNNYAIYQNHPNPFNLTTQIHYDLPEAGHVNITVYDARGQEIRSLVQDIKQPGRHHIVWDGADSSGQIVPTGIYIIKLSTESFKGHIKVMLIK
ncbi:PKD domain-containing protein [bacterium]